jgi:hypothetical protein
VQKQYELFGVKKIDWCGNSPDLNSIEPVWPDMKRITTAKGAPQSREEAERLWIKAWEEYPQEKLQKFVERVRRHVDIVCALYGDNNYVEGLGTRNKERQARIEQRRVELEAALFLQSWNDYFEDSESSVEEESSSESDFEWEDDE